MAYKNIVFADRLVNLTLQNGLVRMDLAVNAGSARDKDDKPVQRMEISSQLVMPLEAFANAVAMQDKLLKEVIARNEQLRDAQKGGAVSDPAPAKPA